MNDQSKTLDPAILLDTPNAISSPASADGVTPCDSPIGRTIDLFGPEVAPASHSARQENKPGRKTTVTSGPSSSGSSASADLTCCLANRLQARLAMAGSTLFQQTWREKVTPLGRSYWAHTASVPRTSGSGCGSWVSPTAQDHSRGVKLPRPWDTGIPLTQQVALASWPTATVHDAERGGQVKRAMGETRHGSNLQDFALLATWPTPSQRDGKGGYQGGRIRQGKLSTDTLDVTAQLADSGVPPTGFPAATEKPGQLNPAHSRWLMGYPPEWDACAAMVTPLSRKSRRK